MIAHTAWVGPVLYRSRKKYRIARLGSTVDDLHRDLSYVCVDLLIDDLDRDLSDVCGSINRSSRS